MALNTYQTAKNCPGDPEMPSDLLLSDGPSVLLVSLNPAGLK